MGRRTRLDPDQTGRKFAKVLQHLCATDALADHHRARNINPINLEYGLRNIEANRANFAHGRLPSMWFALTQPPYGTPMPQSGRRPQHQKRKSARLNGMSGLPLPAQPVDATQALNFSAGVSNCKVSRGRSFS